LSALFALLRHEALATALQFHDVTEKKLREICGEALKKAVVGTLIEHMMELLDAQNSSIFRYEGK